jgi:spore germination protein GerM
MRGFVPAFPSTEPAVEPQRSEPKPTASLPLQPDMQNGGRRILTRGRVIAAIAVLLIASMYLDRAPVNAPEDTSSSADDDESQLALIGSQLPRTAPLPAGRVKVYFNNGVMDQSMTCEKVFPVERETEEPSPEAALRLLFSGPSANEGNAGYFTSVSPGVALRTVEIDNDTATVDVNGHLAWNVERGSCRAQAIRAQITETMKQFTGVRDVAILVDGKADNVFAR